MFEFLKKMIDHTPLKRITYAEFIRLALYDPIRGYYMKSGEKIGLKGDFITSSNISDIFGNQMAKWYFQKTRENNLEPAVCEIGAGNGRFAKAFIEGWNRLTNEQIRYFILEESPYHRELQKQMISFQDNNIQHIHQLESIKPFKGMIFSNELFDALPVHVIEKQKGRLMEAMISVSHDHLEEILVPLDNGEIEEYLQNHNLQLREGQRIEVPLSMEPMVEKISDCLDTGIVITVDYGYTNEEWMDPIHREGSLRGYYKHKLVRNVLLHPGEMDITHHIHFDSLISIGEKYGLRLVEKVRQDQFLLSIGILEELKEHTDSDPFSLVSRRNRAIRDLIWPSGISSYFHVIVQEKGLNLDKDFLS